MPVVLWRQALWGNKMARTFDLKEAADFLKIHKETLRQIARKNKIRGAKVGRGWVFLEEELVNYITSQYSTDGGLRLVANTGEQNKWQSTSRARATTGTSISQVQMGDEYANLLGLKTKPQHKSCTTNSKQSRGA